MPGISPVSFQSERVPHLSHSPLGQGKHKLSLEYLVGLESQEIFPNLIN